MSLILRLTVVVLVCFLLWVAVLWALPASAPLRADTGTLFVTVSGTGTACSQAQPCELQTALAQAAWGDTLYVAAGTYTGSGAAVVTIATSMTLLGGWNGAPAGPVARDPLANRTILDGQGARRVVYCHGSLIGFTIDGFTIQRGNATAGPDPGRGGGIYSSNAWPIITNNVITGNTASAAAAGWAYGGGVYLDLSTAAALIQGNQLLDNVASASSDAVGGGLCLFQSDKAQVLDNLILNNTASVTSGVGYGGGLAVVDSDGATVMGNTIESNHGGSGAFLGGARGGAAYVENSTGVVLEDNRIRNNVAGVAGAGYGGGVAAYWADELVAFANLLEGNVASNQPGVDCLGGAMAIHASHDVSLSSNRVLGNTTSPNRGYGGGLWVQDDSSFTMVNNIVAGNVANLRGGGLALGANMGTPVTGTLLHNTFVANNLGAGEGRVAIFINSGYVSLTLVNNLLSTHSYGLCSEGGTATLNRTLFFNNSGGNTCGSGIINSNPIYQSDPLLDATHHLRTGSAAIDRGVDAGVAADIDGDPRPVGAGYDIGADEYTELHQVVLPVVLKLR